MTIDRPRPEPKLPPPPFQSTGSNDSSIGIAGRIRALADNGSLAALHEALDLLKEKTIAESEFGRLMTAVVVELLVRVYGESRKGLPDADPPRVHAYSTILSEANRGIYHEVPAASKDYLEHILPFLALLNDNTPSRFGAAIQDLENARRIGGRGVLAVYFLGFAHEHLAQFSEALDSDRAALDLADDCYPAAFGIVRIMQKEGETDGAIKLLAGLSDRYPASIPIKRQLVLVYFGENDWDSAEGIIAQARAINRQDPDLILLEARVQIENKKYAAAQSLLDAYAAGNPETRDYSFLRALLQNEGFKNSVSAIKILTPLQKMNGGDLEITLYLTRLLLESDKAPEQAEGRVLLKKTIASYENGAAVPAAVLLLASEDAVRRADWQEAESYQDRILAERRTTRVLLNAFYVEQGLGNKGAALSFARELRERYPDFEEGNIAYAEALIGSGRHSEAQSIINARIAALGSGAFKSRYYYLRSLTDNPDAAISDLRSSLFENPRNLESLKALFETYHKRGDERHAAYYWRQAFALAPDDPLVLQYRDEYQNK
jgi:Tfp pilus assembly protein PilF